MTRLALIGLVPLCFAAGETRGFLSTWALLAGFNGLYTLLTAHWIRPTGAGFGRAKARDQPRVGSDGFGARMALERTPRAPLGRYERLVPVDGRSVPALGPYPSRGDYEHCFTLEGSRGEFVQLTASVARQVARAIEASRSVPRVKRREALENCAQRQEREYDSYADALLS